MDEYELPTSKGKSAKAALPKDDGGASDLLAAIQAGDAKALKLAFQRLYESCGEGHEEKE